MTIKAQRAAVRFCSSVEVDGFLLPDGEFRVGKSSASLALGHHQDYLSRLPKKSEKQFKALKQLGYKGDVVPCQIDQERGSFFVETISESDFDILTVFAASHGKRNAIAILAENRTTGVGKVRKLEPLPRKKVPLKTTRENLEKQIQIKIAEGFVDAQLEVPTLVGKIDILTETQLIEVKLWKRWKEAIGQVLCYGKYYPNHEKRIHFFGSADPEFIDLVVSHCQDHDIVATWD